MSEATEAVAAWLEQLPPRVVDEDPEFYPAAGGKTCRPSHVRAVLAKHTELTGALDDLLEHYVRGVNSGDCGNWDPETEPVVIAARKALEGS